MKFRNGLLIGLGIGYYLGARAGRQRYDQIERVLDKVRTAPQLLGARGRVAELYVERRDRALSRIDEATGGAATSILDLRADQDLTTEMDLSALFDDPSADGYSPSR